ncbi:hypothetical protein KHZ31_09760 [butyrate-producing bacterium]|nr:hypothetical protein [butyrate-producing bacterium]
MAGRLLFRYFYGLSQEKRDWGNLAEVRAGQLPEPPGNRQHQEPEADLRWGLKA